MSCNKAGFTTQREASLTLKYIRNQSGKHNEPDITNPKWNKSRSKDKKKTKVKNSKWIKPHNLSNEE